MLSARVPDLGEVPRCYCPPRPAFPSWTSLSYVPSFMIWQPEWMEKNT